MDKSVNTDLTQRELQEVVEKLTVLENKVLTVKEEHDHMQFRLANISNHSLLGMDTSRSCIRQ